MNIKELNEIFEKFLEEYENTFRLTIEYDEKYQEILDKLIEDITKDDDVWVEDMSAPLITTVIDSEDEEHLYHILGVVKQYNYKNENVFSVDVAELNESLYEDYEMYVIETSDEYLYDIFGEEDGEPMTIDKESLEYLEDYLLEYDETDEDDEPKMDDPNVKAMFEKIKNLLKKYKAVCVKKK